MHNIFSPQRRHSRLLIINFIIIYVLSAKFAYLISMLTKLSRRKLFPLISTYLACAKKTLIINLCARHANLDEWLSSNVGTTFNLNNNTQKKSQEKPEMALALGHHHTYRIIYFQSSRTSVDKVAMNYQSIGFYAIGTPSVPGV
uniref:Uncharacterized protein n=1 Tax=Glossina pallidipes TaxID=7398 RepID=A0A1A9ZSF8_GLOPL